MGARCVYGVALLLVWCGPLFGYEPLSEAELDRTVASGLEEVPATPSDERESDEVSLQTEEEPLDREAVFTLFVYRNALPVVMNRMTSTSKGPLARNGRYSLSPLDGIRSLRVPASPMVLRLGPLPSRFLLFGR